jgi:anti-anti-sigma regulatory factor
MFEQKWQFEQDGLVISASRANGKGTVSWRGISDSRTPGLFLRPVLRDLSEKMKGAEVTVDFTKLEYMNSATVSPLINFVKTLDGACKRILVVFAQTDWQRTHLQCMRAIATTLRNVMVDSAPG